ncbi:MAG: septation protein SepH [Actinomycetota bacterium]|nr:septation protein SepH [Actinomycetota bacterium]
MTELRFIGKSDEGTHLLLHDSDGKDFSLRISDTLRATVNQPRLSSVPEQEVETISVKEIQRRLRAGELPEQLARENYIPIEKIERFSGPILQERIYIIDQAQQIPIRKEGGRNAVTLLGVVVSRLAPRNVDLSDLSWLTWRHEDGTWTLELHYPNNTGHGIAQWNFDPTRRLLVSLDENARWMMGDEPVSRPTPLPSVGLVYSDSHHPSLRQEQTSEPEVPRLAVIREAPDDDAVRDGVVARAKVPSWDEIMFGIKPTKDE